MSYSVSFSARAARRALRIIALVLPLLSLFSADAALGQTTFWVAEGMGNWNVAANWSAGVPTGGTLTQINNGGTARLFDPNGRADEVYLGFNSGNAGTLEVLGGTAQFFQLIVGASGRGTLKIANAGNVSSEAVSLIGASNGSSGTVTVDGPGSRWTLPSPLRVGAAGMGELDVTGGGEVTSFGGSIGVGGGSNGTATIDGSGSKWINTIELDVGFNGTGSLSIQNSGVVSNANGYLGRNPLGTGTASVGGAGSAWTNSGDLAVGYSGAGAMSITGGGRVSNVNSQVGLQLNSTGTATVDGAGSVWTNNSVLAVGVFGAGELSITGGGRVTSFHGRIGREADSTGAVVVDGPGSKWTINEQLTIGLSDRGTGTLSVQNGGTVSAAVVTVGPNATVRGDGTIIGNVTNTGTVAPGASLGALQVTGNYWQLLGGKLQIELASPTSFNKLAVTGNVTLEPEFGFGFGSGPLVVSLANGYIPRGSQSFDILDWTGTLSGAFPSIQLPTLGGTLVWDTTQLYTTGALLVAAPGLPGDYNLDGSVDAADYVVWRKGLGTTYTQEHYNIWRANFGDSRGAGSLSDATVSEPASALLLIFVAAIGGWSRGRYG